MAFEAKSFLGPIIKYCVFHQFNPWTNIMILFLDYDLKWRRTTTRTSVCHQSTDSLLFFSSFPYWLHIPEVGQPAIEFFVQQTLFLVLHFNLCEIPNHKYPKSQVLSYHSCHWKDLFFYYVYFCFSRRFYRKEIQKTISTNSFIQNVRKFEYEIKAHCHSAFSRHKTQNTKQRTIAYCQLKITIQILEFSVETRN